MILPALDLEPALAAEHAEQRRPYHGAAVAREAVRRPRDVLQVAQLQPAAGGEAVGRHGAGPGPPVPASGQQQDLRRAVNEVSRKETNELIRIREYRPTTWAFLLGPAGGNSLLFLSPKATHKKSYLLP